MHKIRAIIAVLAIAALSLMMMPVEAGGKLAVSVNQSQVLNLYGVERVAVANPEIADVVVVSSSEILLVGKAPGVTTLHIWQAGGRDSFSVEVGTNDTLIAQEIKEILGYSDIRVSKVNKNIILEGSVNDQYQKQRAEKVAAAYGDKVVNLLEITKPVQVKIEARVIEISKQKTENLGIKWGNNTATPGRFQFGQTPNANGSITYKFYNPYTGSLESSSGPVWNNVVARNKFGSFGQQWKALGGYYDINGQLDALIQQGAAKILSQPHVITLSGEKANIMIGGQIPIPVSNNNGSVTVEWKDFGIKLDISPEVNSDGLINSKIKAEVSTVDWSSDHQIGIGAGMAIPPINQRKAETVIALSSGQTMAIGGLIANEDNRAVTKIPLLADLPIIGKLFTSKAFSRNETELIILVTPTIVDPAEYVPQETKEMKLFVEENPWGVKNNDKNKSTSR